MSDANLISALAAAVAVWVGLYSAHMQRVYPWWMIALLLVVGGVIVVVGFAVHPTLALLAGAAGADAYRVVLRADPKVLRGLLWERPAELVPGEVERFRAVCAKRTIRRPPFPRWAARRDRSAAPHWHGKAPHLPG